MERKIGEIFKYNEEWYQCLKGISCKECDFSSNGITCDIHGAITCTRKSRSDDTSVVFKKLENVGKPYIKNVEDDLLYQLYKLPMNVETLICQCYWVSLIRSDIVEIAIKQNKEDMEEKNLNLKPFDIQKAREGKPVCTRDGRKERIICFDKKGDFPIIALVDNGKGEEIYYCYKDGRSDRFMEYDLMMTTEKKEGWVNVYYDNDASSHRGCRFIYDTKERAVKEAGSDYITTVKIKWEE